MTAGGVPLGVGVVLTVGVTGGGTITHGDPVDARSVRAAAGRGLVTVAPDGRWGEGSTATLTDVGWASAQADREVWAPVAAAALLLVDLAYPTSPPAQRLVAARQAATRPGYRAALVDMADEALGYDDGDPRWRELRAAARTLDDARGQVG